MTKEGAMFTHTRNKAAVTSRSVSPGVRWHAGSPGVRWHAGSRRLVLTSERCPNINGHRLTNESQEGHRLTKEAGPGSRAPQTRHGRQLSSRRWHSGGR